MQNAKKWMVILAGIFSVLAIVSLALVGMKGFYMNDSNTVWGNAKVDAYTLIFGGDFSYAGQAIQMKDGVEKIVDANGLIYYYFSFSPINFLGWILLMLGMFWTFITMKDETTWLKIASAIFFIVSAVLLFHLRHNSKVAVDPATLHNTKLMIGTILPAIFTLLAGALLLVSVFLNPKKKTSVESEPIVQEEIAEE